MRSRPALADRSLIQPSGAARLYGCGASPMRRADPGHHAGGANCFAPSRNDPLASAGRSAFTLRGSEPPRQLRPALVCLRRDPLLLCEANRPAFGSLRRGSADPLRHVWLTTCCAGQPLAAAGPEESIFKAISPPAAPGGPRAWGAPAMPGCPARAAGDNSHALPALGPPAVRLPASRPSQTHLPGARASLPARAAHRLPAGAANSPAVPSASTSGPAPPLQFPPLKSLFPPPPSAKARWIVVCAPVLKASRE